MLAGGVLGLLTGGLLLLLLLPLGHLVLRMLSLLWLLLLARFHRREGREGL